MSIDYASLIRHCHLCNAEVIWLRNENTGKVAPIDAVLGWGGNIEIDLEAGTYGLRKFEGKHRAYRSHFSTCPQAASVRKRKPVAGKRAT